MLVCSVADSITISLCVGRYPDSVFLQYVCISFLQHDL